jgi:hypothetical protein
MDVAANMTVLTSFITRAAAVQGISPKEFVERYMPEIQQRVLGEEAAEAAPVVEVVEAAPEMSEAMTEASEAPVTRVMPVVADAVTEGPQRQAAEPEPAAEPEVEVAPEVEPEVTEEAAPTPEPAAQPGPTATQLFEGDATPEQIAKFESFLPPRNDRGLFVVKELKPKERHPQMKAACPALQAGEITRSQWDSLVDIYLPTGPFKEIREPASAQRVEEVVNVQKKPKANKESSIRPGDKVGLRIDIPAMNDHQTAVVVIHEAKGRGGGKPIAYTSVARISNAEMLMMEGKAVRIAGGENKDRMAIIKGDHVPVTREEATALAKEALNDPAWRQVSFNPERHGYYYDRKTGEPIVSADEVVQVGMQVFAKNAKVAGKEQFLYSKEAAAAFDESAYRPEVVAWAKEQFGDRVAPNGKPVYQNFVRWFGDSKVVTIKEFDGEDKLVIDPNGVPIPVYHGTPSPGFETFDPAKMGTGPHAGYDTGPGKGFFFSSDPEVVRRYTSDYDDRGAYQGGTYPVYLSMQNPLVVTGGFVSVEADDQVFLQESIDEARSKGHDGVIFRIEEEGVDDTASMSAEELESLSTRIGVSDPSKARQTRPLYIVFNSNQIKSTLQGRSDEYGDFSADPRILYSKEGEAPRATVDYLDRFSEDDTFEKGWKDRYGRNAEDDEYVYHVTTPERAQAILESGELSPGQQQSMDEGFYKGYSAGKVFLAEKSGVDFWASTVREHLQAQQDEEVGDLVVLRVPWDAVKDQLENDEVGERDSKAGSYFSTKPIRLYRGKPTPRKKMKVDTLLRLATGTSIKNVKEAYELLGKGVRPDGKFGPEFSQGVRSLLSGQIAFDEVYSDVLADAPNEALKIAFERQGLDPDLVDLDAALFDPSKEGPKQSTIEAVQEQLSQEFNEYETAKFLLSVAQTLDELAPKEGGYSRANQVLDSIARVFGEGYDTALEGDTVLLYSKEGDKKVLGTASFEGTDAIKKILLDPNAKPTTLMHELMHWNLELMSNMSLNIEQKEEAQRNALEKQVLKDTTALLEWAGYEGTLEGWRQMDLDARRPFHEAIAASFELFLYKGEAPSRQLKGIFQRLLNYINESYRQIVKRFQKEYEDEFKRPLPALNDDVRAIFGRMMSAERDTMDFFDQYDMTARLVTREQWEEAGRDPKDYDEYDRDFKDAIAEAQAELTQRRMEEVGWQGRARERTGAKIREERRRTEAKAREDIDAEVRETQIFQLQSYIYNGYYRAVDNPRVEPAKAESTRLSYEAVAAIDEEMAKKLASRGLLKKKNGIPLDVARNMFGFESNEQMLQQLSESRSINDEVEYRLDRYMIEEQSGLTDPVLVEERIQAAIHNRMRERVIGLELRYILNNGKNTKQELANAREMARDIIARTPTGDINLTAYNRAAARARKKALKALKDGDMEAAAFAKRQELLNEALIREGGKAREEVRKLVNANKRVFRHRSDKALAKAGYDVVIVKGLRALLSRLGIGGAFEGDPAAAMDAMRQKHPEFSKEMQSEIEHFLGLDLPEAGSVTGASRWSA